MTVNSTEAVDERYPIGRFSYPEETSRAALDQDIADIAALPSQLRESVRGLTAEQLDTPYREGGWTPRQVVHHVADSHANAYVRLKLALTEQAPTIKPYNEADWARLGDVQTVPIETSLTLVDALHERWVAILRGMTEADFDRVYLHPEQQKPVPMHAMTALYAWHGKHHVAHISGLRERNRWV
ncbi:MAG: putative metal-dependent hydrolase [Gemmatimonadota bacterium]|nr:putative metal-dependent hydrolase [Gemmatimonadota bacterium]